MYIRIIFARLALGVTLAGLTLLIGPAAADPLDKLQGDSQWNGRYFYPESDEPRAPVSYSLTPSVSASGLLSGSTKKPNTFGNKSASRLYATVRGSIDGPNVQFTKTSDGTGGVSHSAAYRSKVSNDESTMWRRLRLDDYGGAFNLRLVQYTGKASNSCITPGQLRTTNSFVYWNFHNRCDKGLFVHVCARYANGNNNILGVNVPARQSADISLGHASLGQAKLSWKEGGGISCPKFGGKETPNDIYSGSWSWHYGGESGSTTSQVYLSWNSKTHAVEGSASDGCGGSSLSGKIDPKTGSMLVMKSYGSGVCKGMSFGYSGKITTRGTVSGIWTGNYPPPNHRGDFSGRKN